MLNVASLRVTRPGPREAMLTRAFDAPPRLVFEAMTNPEYIKRWYGPEGCTVTHCESDLRVGGVYRIVQRGPDGSEWAFRGVYREIVVPKRRVYTWIFEPMPDKEAVVTETFEENAGQTVFTARLLFATPEDLDGFLSTGAEEGSKATYARLDEVLKTMPVR